MEIKKVVIVGGGTAGITVASRLLHSGVLLQIQIIEPAQKHYYQPLWTLVGGGLCSIEETSKEMKDVMPSEIEWIQESVTELQPERNCVITDSGKEFPYDLLVLVPGIRLAYEEVAGLREALEEDPRVWTNYSVDYVTKGMKAIEAFQGGNAFFTFPFSPIKCGGAPQKIMWITEEHLRKMGKREQSEVHLVVPGEKIFGIPKYCAALEKLQKKRGVHLLPKHHLVAIDHEKSEATFVHVDTQEQVKKQYDLLHVSVPQRSYDFIINSSLSTPEGHLPTEQVPEWSKQMGCILGGAGGFVDVDMETTQSNRFSNVFSIGDASSLPTAKTGAAIRKQAPVLVQNALSFLQNEPLTAKYNGYTSCPLVVSHHQVILAEFGYESKVMETFPFDQSKPRWSMWMLKRYMLPPLYWYGMLKGRA